MVKIGTVGFDLVAYTGGLTKPLRMAQRQVESFGRSIRSSIGGAMAGVRGALSSTTAQILGLGGAVTAGGLIAHAMKLAVAYEDAEMAFSTFLRSGEKAKALLADLKKFSDITPFTSEQAQTAGRGLLAFGFAAQDIIPTLQYLGDAAAGSQQDINDLVNILGKIRSKGKLQLEELNRFTERGIMLIPELAKQLGVTDKEVYKFISAGKIGFGQVEQALRSLNGEGGIFQDAMKNLSQTTSGKLSTLKSAFDGIMKDVGTALLQGMDIKGITDRLTQIIERYRDSVMAAVSTAVNAVVTGMGAVGQAIEWASQYVHYFVVAWKGAQLGVQLFVTGAVDVLALLVQGIELTVEGIASAFSWAWSRASQLATDSVSWMITKVAEFLTWMDSKLPESMQTGLGKAATQFATTYEQIAAENRRMMEAQEWRVDFDMGGQTSRAFADVMLDQARQASQDFWDFVNSDQTTRSMPDSMQAAVDNVQAAVGAAVAQPLNSMAESTKNVSSGAVERGSQEAFKAIVDTMKDNTIDRQQLEAQKNMLVQLKDISKNTKQQLAPAGLA